MTIQREAIKRYDSVVLFIIPCKLTNTRTRCYSVRFTKKKIKEMHNFIENFSRQNFSTEETLEDLTLDTETKVIFTFLGITALLITVVTSLSACLSVEYEIFAYKNQLISSEFGGKRSTVWNLSYSSVYCM